MKLKLVYILLLLVFVACGSSSNSTSDVEIKSKSSVTKKKDIVHITDHKTFETTFKADQFYSWLAKQSPKNQFLQSSLEIENLQYAMEWNRRVDNSDFDSNLYTHQINYQIQPKKHYGMDVNYELYMYFKFFEETHEKLLTNS